MKLPALVVLAAFVASIQLAALAQPRDPCMEAYNAEVVRIEREGKARQETGSAAAKERAARTAQAQSKDAARRAQQCQAEAKEKAKPDVAVAPRKPGHETECRARADAHAAELERRYAGRNLEGAELNARRDEEVKVRAELQECLRGPR